MEAVKWEITVPSHRIPYLYVFASFVRQVLSCIPILAKEWQLHVSFSPPRALHSIASLQTIGPSFKIHPETLYIS
jgi:hypothetical protein